MTKREAIENKAYMILSDLAFCFINEGQNNKLIAINLKNINQIANFRIRGKDLLLCESNMSKENTYKAMLIVERNKERLIDGMIKWVNTQNKK